MSTQKILFFYWFYLFKAAFVMFSIFVTYVNNLNTVTNIFWKIQTRQFKLLIIIISLLNCGKVGRQIVLDTLDCLCFHSITNFVYFIQTMFIHVISQSACKFLVYFCNLRHYWNKMLYKFYTQCSIDCFFNACTWPTKVCASIYFLF